MTRANAALAAWDAVDYGPVPPRPTSATTSRIAHGDDLIFVQPGQRPRRRASASPASPIYDRAGGTLQRILTAETGRRAPGGGWQLADATLFDVDSGRLQRMAAGPPRRATSGPTSSPSPRSIPTSRISGALRGVDRRAARRRPRRPRRSNPTSGTSSPAPLSTMLMPLLAAVAAFGLARSGQLMVRAVIGMALGFAYFVADNFALAMGNLGAYPPFLAAWGPFLLFLLVGEAVLIRTEE